MRLIIVASVALLLAAAVPALAHNPNTGGSEDHELCGLHDHVDLYKGDMKIDRSLYARGGWWQGETVALSNQTPPDRTSDGTADGADWICGGDGDVDDDGNAGAGREAPVWLRLTNAPDEPWSNKNKQPFEITVTANGGVMAGVDVFENQDRAGPWESQTTPPCPQGLVFPDLLPEDGEAADSYLFRVAHETVGMHQRGRTATDLSSTQTDTISIVVDPDEARRGEYVVAIYPQVATSHQADAAGLDGPDNITWSVDTGSGTFSIDDGDDAPQMPLDVLGWLDPIDRPFDCAEKLPGVIEDAQGRELPTLPGAAQPSRLLSEHLGDA